MWSRSDRPAQPHASAQEPLRVDRLAVDARLVMQMRAGGAPSRADTADDLADPNSLPDFHIDCRKMRVARRKAVAVVDLDHLAVAAVPARDGHGAGRGRARRFPGVGTDVAAG